MNIIQLTPTFLSPISSHLGYVSYQDLMSDLRLVFQCRRQLVNSVFICFISFVCCGSRLPLTVATKHIFWFLAPVADELRSESTSASENQPIHTFRVLNTLALERSCGFPTKFKYAESSACGTWLKTKKYQTVPPVRKDANYRTPAVNIPVGGNWRTRRNPTTQFRQRVVRLFSHECPESAAWSSDVFREWKQC
jgi:hypothetical protein